eukprot:6061684-Pyramimonas_sp.AAC.1
MYSATGLLRVGAEAPPLCSAVRPPGPALRDSPAMLLLEAQQQQPGSHYDAPLLVSPPGFWSAVGFKYWSKTPKRYALNRLVRGRFIRILRSPYVSARCCLCLPEK